MKIAVVYLAWKPFGVVPVTRFLSSYLAHPAGIEHDLIVHESSQGQDVSAYYHVAESIDHDYVCFVNTEALILADNWLLKMASLAQRDGIGLVGAFASWEGCPNGTAKFPNAHIRSNGFLIRRRALLWYVYPVETKQDCYEFESGSVSLSRMIRNHGLLTVLATKESFYGAPGEWAESKTFRLGNQENLLLSDRQSRHYDEANAEERKRLTELAWGKA